MSTILIATDFSNAARNATLYGLQLAKALDSHVILFNAYQMPIGAPGLGVSISKYDLQIQAEEQLNAEVINLSYVNLGKMEPICDEGLPETAIINIANEKKVDYIIMGMKTHAVGMKKIFGSTVTALARNSNIPVIIIPEIAKFTIPKILLYASDISFDSNIKPIDLIQSITEQFQSKLYVIRVVEDELAEMFETYNAPGTLREGLEILHTTFQYPVGTDIRHALNIFIQTHHVNMLVMMPHKHKWMERLFIKSETKDMIFHTHIPIVILPEKHSKLKMLNEKDIQEELHFIQE